MNPSQETPKAPTPGVPQQTETEEETTTEEEGEKYTGGEIPRVSPSEENEN